jgi:hypothetical protein
MGDLALTLDTMKFQEIFRDRRGHASYQGVVEQLRSLHRKAVPIKFKVIDIKILRENQFADKTRKACVLVMIEKGFLDIESKPAVCSNELQGIEEGSWGDVSKTESCNAG